MIKQFRTLQKVKKLREDKAMRALQAARATLADACRRRDELTAKVTQDAETLPARERQAYQRIIDKVVNMGDVDDVKEEVLHLLAEHQKLIDRRDRARDHVVRCEEKLKEARAELKRKQQEVEKIDTITDELAAEIAEEETAKEEIEIEDLFSRPRGMAAMAAGAL